LRVFRRLKWNYIADDTRSPGIEGGGAGGAKGQPVFLEIGEADASGHVAWTWPVEGSMIPAELKSNEEWWAAVKPSSSNARDITAVWLNKNSGPKYMALIMSLSVGEPDPNDRMLVARVMPQPFIEKLIDARTRANDNIEISDGSIIFYRLGAKSASTRLTGRSRLRDSPTGTGR